MATHQLHGLRAEPYSSYLAALGLFRILSEQVDPQTAACWDRGHFVLSTAIDPVDFLLHSYAPTPIASPWNAGSGFHPGEDAKPRQALAASTEARFQPYRQTLAAISQTLASLGLEDRPEAGPGKNALLSALKQNLPPSGRRWIDAVVTMEQGQPRYSRLLFSGGNDSKFELSRRFMAYLAKLFLDPPADAQQLKALLHDEICQGLARETHGPLDPSTSLVHNSSSDGLGQQVANPWSYVLALEGLIALQELKPAQSDAPSYGRACLVPDEDGKELRLPLWTQPLTLEQLPQAAVQHHKRYVVVPRNGRGQFVVPESAAADALKLPGEALQWLNSRPKPPSVPQTLERLGALRLHATDFPTLPHTDMAKATDRSAEFALALSLSGLGSGQAAPLHLRPHLQAMQGKDLCERMIGLTRRRIHLAQTVSRRPNRAGIVRFNGPFWSAHPAHPDHVRAFLEGRLNEPRLEHLLHALCLTDWPPPDHPRPATGVRLLPLAYRVLKLAFHQFPGDRRPPPLDILDQLSRGHLETAWGSAAKFLSGRHPEAIPPYPGRPGSINPRRLAAALLFPISSASYQTMLGSL
jgi:CRISPR-associated protein Csx17